MRRSDSDEGRIGAGSICELDPRGLVPRAINEREEFSRLSNLLDAMNYLQIQERTPGSSIDLRSRKNGQNAANLMPLTSFAASYASLAQSDCIPGRIIAQVAPIPTAPYIDSAVTGTSDGNKRRKVQGGNVERDSGVASKGKGKQKGKETGKGKGTGKGSHEVLYVYFSIQFGDIATFTVSKDNQRRYWFAYMTI